MKAYHEIDASSLKDVLKNGLVRTSRGEKGDDSMIIRTDHFLDNHRPQQLIAQGVSRANNLYAYLCVDGHIIDITDGKHIPIDAFITNSKRQVLEIAIDPEKCFVSDLDAYDALKSALESHRSPSTLDRLASAYWDKVIRLQDFDLSMIDRPEIMITYDIPPNKLSAS